MKESKRTVELEASGAADAPSALGLSSTSPSPFASTDPSSASATTLASAGSNTIGSVTPCPSPTSSRWVWTGGAGKSEA